MGGGRTRVETQCGVTRWLLDNGSVVWEAISTEAKLIIQIHGEAEGDGTVEYYELAWRKPDGRLAHQVGLLAGKTAVNNEREAAELAADLILRHISFVRTETGALEIREKQLVSEEAER